MDDNCSRQGEAQSVFADMGDGKGLTVHGFFRLGQYTNSSSAYRHQRKRKKFFCRAVNHLLLNFLTNFLCLQFPMIPRSSLLGSELLIYAYCIMLRSVVIVFYCKTQSLCFGTSHLCYSTNQKAPSVGDV